MKNSSGQMRQISRRMKMIHPMIGWRRDEHRTHKHTHGLWILWAQLFEGPVNPGVFFLCSKAFSLIIFFDIFRASNHQLVDKKIKTDMLFKLSNLNSNLSLTLGYLNPALNNSALICITCCLKGCILCITSWLPYITLCYIDSRFFLPLEQPRMAL